MVDMEGIGFVNKTNVKPICITCFIFAAIVCCIVNQYIYHEMIFDYFPLKFFNFKPNGEVIDTKLSAESLDRLNKLSDAPTSNPFRRNIFAKMKDIKKTSRNIFFFETKCSTEKGMKDYLNNTGFILNARQCCSVESTAVMNLDRPVYVFHSCPISEDFLKHSPKFVEKLFNYPNIYIVTSKTSDVFHNTPLQELYEKRLLETSVFPAEHAADVMSLLFLWMFGGTYCDYDVVTISNWAGSQDDDTINNAVINVEPDGTGHDLMQRILEHVNKHFDGSQWDVNGPLLITPFILKECQANSVPQAVQMRNGSFTVLSSDKLYPIRFYSWEDFFNKDVGMKVVENVKTSAFCVHFWNKLSHDAKVQVKSTQAYALLAGEFCPEVYQNCGHNF